MMTFIDRVSGSDQFSSLILTQPQHQQRFTVSRGLDSGELKVDIRRYTLGQSTRESDEHRHEILTEIKTPLLEITH